MIHHKRCPRLQFWDAGEWECPCLCPVGWPKKKEGSYKLPKPKELEQ